MPRLTIRYIPGLQEDLTAWELRVTEEGKIEQEIDVCRFSPSENFQERHSSALSPTQLSELKVLLATLNFDEINKAEKQYVFDDSEQVHFKTEANGLRKEFTSAVEYWLWRQLRGEPLPCHRSA